MVPVLCIIRWNPPMLELPLKRLDMYVGQEISMGGRYFIMLTILFQAVPKFGENNNSVLIIIDSTA